jgi:DeoR/GlpR family transcriptional regulator of sugar metabolism
MNRSPGPIERRNFIVTSLEQGDAIRVSDVAKMFRCSERGIQNDLRYLRSLGLKIRTKRGVIEAKKDKSVTLIRQLEFPNYKDRHCIKSPNLPPKKTVGFRK